MINGLALNIKSLSTKDYEIFMLEVFFGEKFYCLCTLALFREKAILQVARLNSGEYPYSRDFITTEVHVIFDLNRGIAAGAIDLILT